MEIQIFQFLIQIFCLILQFIHIQIQSLYLFHQFCDLLLIFFGKLNIQLIACLIHHILNILCTGQFVLCHFLFYQCHQIFCFFRISDILHQFAGQHQFIVCRIEILIVNLFPGHGLIRLDRTDQCRRSGNRKRSCHRDIRIFDAGRQKCIAIHTFGTVGNIFRCYMDAVSGFFSNDQNR